MMKNILLSRIAGALIFTAAPGLWAADHDGRGDHGRKGGPQVTVQGGMRGSAHVQSRATMPINRDRARVTTQAPRITTERTRDARTPSVAFGGSVRGDRFDTGTRTREFRSDWRAVQPSRDISRTWNRDRIYSWNNHRWRWYNNDWTIVDGTVEFDQAPVITTYSTVGPQMDVGTTMASEIQARLTRRGYDPGPVDGVIGAQTRDAIADFQADHGLSATGRVDTALLHSLGL